VTTWTTGLGNSCDYGRRIRFQPSCDTTPSRKGNTPMVDGRWVRLRNTSTGCCYVKSYGQDDDHHECDSFLFHEHLLKSQEWRCELAHSWCHRDVVSRWAGRDWVRPGPVTVTVETSLTISFVVAPAAGLQSPEYVAVPAELRRDQVRVFVSYIIKSIAAMLSSEYAAVPYGAELVLYDMAGWLAGWRPRQDSNLRHAV
jgi:hypothetical protein